MALLYVCIPEVSVLSVPLPWSDYANYGIILSLELDVLFVIVD